MHNAKTVMMLEDAADGLISALALIFFDAYMGEGSILAIVSAGAALSLCYRLADLNAAGGTPLRGTYIGRLLSTSVVFFLLYPIALYIFADGRIGIDVMLVSIATAFVLTALIYLRKRLTYRILSSVYRREERRVRILLVGDNRASAEQLRLHLDGEYPPREIVATVGDELCGVSGEHLGDMASLGEALSVCRPDAVVFAVKKYDEAELTRAVALCDDSCARVYFLPVIYGFFKSAGQVEYAGGIPLINLHSSPLDLPSSAILKRTLDILGSLALILLTLPVMAVCAVGVKLSSDGPILFRQRRVGKLGREFVMLKFRSMRRGEGENSTWSSGIDKRKTRFGNLMRRTSLDELPQLFNVLAGDMSLVGPRPEIPVFVNKFKHEIPLYMLKHYVKPGITGLAQIRGLRGDTSLVKRIEADLYYIENWSVWLDIKILLLTPMHAINKKEKYTETKK